MSTLTPKIGLVRPIVTENFDLEEHFNVNWDKLDTMVGDMSLRTSDYNVYVSSKSGDYYTNVQFKRHDGTLYMKSVLTVPDSNGYFTTDTWTIYDIDGLTVVGTMVWIFTYDIDGNVLTKILS